MIFGDLAGLELPDIFLEVRKYPEKNSPRKPVPAGDRTPARCVTDAHANACSTEVDTFLISKLKNVESIETTQLTKIIV